MKKILAILIFLTSHAFCAHIHPEKYYQTLWCDKWHGIAEYKLEDKTRVDCLTTNYAVEFDFAPKWAEAIGQAMYYSKMTNRQGAVILILEKPSDWKYYNRAKKIANEANLKLWYMMAPFYGIYEAMKEYARFALDSFEK